MYIIDEDLYIAEENNDIAFYEWIEDLENTINITKLELNLATEVCNLRSLDLTDENIDMIIKEFS